MSTHFQIAQEGSFLKIIYNKLVTSPLSLSLSEKNKSDLCNLATILNKYSDFFKQSVRFFRLPFPQFIPHSFSKTS